MKIHTFNTGRRYTASGQRIAWTVLSGHHVAMVDVDRNINYILDVSSLVADPLDIRDRDVLSAYDNHVQAPWDPAEYNELHELEGEMRAVAFAQVDRPRATCACQHGGRPSPTTGAVVLSESCAKHGKVANPAAWREK